jgi:hypothetical protein
MEKIVAEEERFLTTARSRGYPNGLGNDSRKPTNAFLR